MRPLLRDPDGTPFRDLHHDGATEPYEDPRLPVGERVEDLPAGAGPGPSRALRLRTFPAIPILYG